MKGTNFNNPQVSTQLSSSIGQKTVPDFISKKSPLVSGSLDWDFLQQTCVSLRHKDNSLSRYMLSDSASVLKRKPPIVEFLKIGSLKSQSRVVFS